MWKNKREINQSKRGLLSRNNLIQNKEKNTKNLIMINYKQQETSNSKR
jgi:hypothetical protein